MRGATAITGGILVLFGTIAGIADKLLNSYVQ